MDVERVRGFLMMMRSADKAALTGGGLTLPALYRPHIDVTSFGDFLLPYEVTEPFGIALGCTFSSLVCSAVAAAHIGEAVRNEWAFAGKVHCGLMRDPMSADAAEFFSEDPFLTTELLKSFSAVDGIGFVFCDCLGQGRYVNRTIDERALRELYLFPLVQMGRQAAALMLDGGYLNGENVCSSAAVFDLYSEYIDEDIPVFTTYGFKPDVYTDGLPGSGRAYMLGEDASEAREIARKAASGEISQKALDKAALRMLSAALDSRDFYDAAPHAQLENATMPDIIVDCTVMLKNDGTLPTDKPLTFFGDATMFPDGDKFGVTPINQAADKLGSLNVFLITGYEENGISAETASVLIGACRTSKTVIVLCGCCATPLPMAADASAILFCPVMPRIKKIAEMLGGVSPKGRLPFTWCASKDDYPCNNKKFAVRGDFRYESMYNGYMLFNNFKSNVLFPFGHGLDYTEFEITKLSVTNKLTKLGVEFVVKNTGNYAGDAVCQAYITLVNAPVYGLTRRLAAVKRIPLDKTENTRVYFEINLAEFAVYDEKDGSFSTLGGRYRVDVGFSSVDIRASGEAKLAAGSRSNAGLNAKLAPSYYATGTGAKFSPTAPEIERLLKVPFIKKPDERPDIAPPSAAAVKKLLKKANKTTPKRLLPIVRRKILSTPLPDNK